MHIVLPQLFNAITMISPLWVWFRKRKSHNKFLFHKCLIVHIPISVAYHLSHCFSLNTMVVTTFKVIDCILVHSYTMLCNLGIATYTKLRVSRFENLLRKGAYSLNVSCIIRMVRQPQNIDDIMFSLTRVIALGVLSGSTFRHTNQHAQGLILGTISAMLYMADDILANYGHCLFHIALGGLHHTTYLCFDV